MLASSQTFKIVLMICDEFFAKMYLETTDTMVVEAVLYYVDFVKYLMGFSRAHEHIRQQHTIPKLFEMLRSHKQPQVVMSVCSALNEAAKHKMFYTELLGEMQVDTLLKAISSGEGTEVCLSMLMKLIDNTKPPVKYLIAAKVLKLSENADSLLSINLSLLIRLLCYINDSASKYQEPDSAFENFTGIVLKTLKFGLVATTNLLLKSDIDVLLSSLPLLKSLLFHAAFERDTQINLRVLFLLQVHLRKDQVVDDEACRLLADFLVDNISKFRQLFENS
jgi:hypothetical protein